MEPGTSRAEQQEITWWNETMSGISSNADSGVAANTSAILEFTIHKNGTGTGEMYDNDVGFGGRDWLALFFMTFGKGIRAVQTHHGIDDPVFHFGKIQVGSCCSLRSSGFGESKDGRCQFGRLRVLKLQSPLVTSPERPKSEGTSRLYSDSVRIGNWKLPSTPKWRLRSGWRDI